MLVSTKSDFLSVQNASEITKYAYSIIISFRKNIIIANTAVFNALVFITYMRKDKNYNKC